LACRSNRIAGEQTSEVDELEGVAHVRDIGLKLQSAIFPLVEIDPTVAFCVK
jgi:hypothetical protein